MVGGKRRRNFDYPSQKVWKDFEHEHGGKIFFCSVCGQRGFISGT